MSGIYIPNMAIPGKGHCKIVIIHNDTEVCDFYTRDKVSNAIPVPNHGRLIDADELLKEAKRLSGPMTGDGWDNWGVYALIERQPTIIEAEGERE